MKRRSGNKGDSARSQGFKGKLDEDKGAIQEESSSSDGEDLKHARTGNIGTGGKATSDLLFLQKQERK